MESMAGVNPKDSKLKENEEKLTKCEKLSKFLKDFMWQSLPPLTWIPQYSLKTMLLSDLIAGLTVGVMLIPQGMAYSLLATLPPEFGLYSATIPLFIYAIFGTSRQLAVGPVAVISLLVAEAVSQQDTDEKKVEVALILAFFAGVISIAFSLFRAGVVANFLSHAILVGFTAGAAVIIGLSQLKHLLGFNIPRFTYPLQTLIYAFEHITETKPAVITMGIIAIVILLALRTIKRKWASKKVEDKSKKLLIWTKYVVKLIANLNALVVVIIGTLVTQALYENYGYDKTTLPIVGEIPAGFLPPRAPPFSRYSDEIPNLFVSALIIAILGFMESYAVAQNYAEKLDYKVDANQELLALGAANFVGSFFNAFAVTGGFSRTAVNADSGALTPIASIVSAIVVIFALSVLTSAFFFLPKNVLAAIVIVAVSGLFNVHAMKQAFRVARYDFYVMLLTFLATIGLGVEIGLAIGVAFSLIVVLRAAAFPHYAILGRITSPVTKEIVYRNILRFPEAEVSKSFVILRVDAPIWFANASYFHTQVLKSLRLDHITSNEKAVEKDSLKAIIVDFSPVDFVDMSGLEKLHQLQSELNDKGLRFIVAAAKGPVRDAFIKFNEYEAKHAPDSPPLAPWIFEIKPGDLNFMTATLEEAISFLEPEEAKNQDHVDEKLDIEIINN